MKNRGFTLMEVLVVINMIAILACILFPVFARARETARKASCASNLGQIGMALQMYARDYNGQFPKEDNEFLPLYSYVSNEDIWWCPSDPEKQERKHRTDEIFSSYVYKGGLTTESRKDIPISGERKAWHSQAYTLYVGGYVKGQLRDCYKPIIEPKEIPQSSDGYPGPPAPRMIPGPPPMPAPGGS